VSGYLKESACLARARGEQCGGDRWKKDNIGLMIRGYHRLCHHHNRQHILSIVYPASNGVGRQFRFQRAPSTAAQTGQHSTDRTAWPSNLQRMTGGIKRQHVSSRYGVWGEERSRPTFTWGQRNVQSRTATRSRPAITWGQRNWTRTRLFVARLPTYLSEAQVWTHFQGFDAVRRINFIYGQGGMRRSFLLPRV